MIKQRVLYSTALSGHGHRVEQFLKFLDLDYIYVESLTDFRHSKEFLKLNPLGQIPVLKDGDFILSDSCAILIYLAKTYAQNTHWLPESAIQQAYIQRWLAIATGELKYGCAFARAIKLWNFDADLLVAQKIANKTLKFINNHLFNRQWLETDFPTIADIACYGYIAVSSEGGINLSEYPNIQNWLHNFENLPNFHKLVPAQTTS